MESGLSWAFAGTLQVRINVVFQGAVSFPWFQQWNAFVSESACACQHNFDSFPRLRTPREIGRRETAAQRAAAACARGGAKSVRIDPQHLSPIAKILAPAERFYGLGAGVGRGLG